LPQQGIKLARRRNLPGDDQHRRLAEVGIGDFLKQRITRCELLNGELVDVGVRNADVRDFRARIAN
jgi:hypothetical protein